MLRTLSLSHFENHRPLYPAKRFSSTSLLLKNITCTLLLTLVSVCLWVGNGRGDPQATYEECATHHEPLAHTLRFHFHPTPTPPGHITMSLGLGMANRKEEGGEG